VTSPAAPNRREAGAGLVLIAAWLAITGWETVTFYSGYTWNLNGVYFRMADFVGAAKSGVVLAVAAVWLAGRSRAFRRL
jgi:hypothetical protein